VALRGSGSGGARAVLGQVGDALAYRDIFMISNSRRISFIHSTNSIFARNLLIVVLDRHWNELENALTDGFPSHRHSQVSPVPPPSRFPSKHTLSHAFSNTILI
jgi:hypothetical protein